MTYCVTVYCVHVFIASKPLTKIKDTFYELSYTFPTHIEDNLVSYNSIDQSSLGANTGLIFHCINKKV